MRVAIFLVGLLAAGSAAAETVSSDNCAAGAPVEQLICRDAGLTAAGRKLEGAAKALEEATDPAARPALQAAQQAWLRHRDGACPVAAADLADARKAKGRADCLLRQTGERTAALEASLAARRAPVADQPLVITDAGPLKLAPVQVKPVLPKRQAGAPALAGRWAKADPSTRAPIDDCRTSYLDIVKDQGGKDQAIGLRDPRISGFPVEGKLALAEGDPVQGMAFGADGAGIKGFLRLDAAEIPRLDRLFLRLEQPMAFGATFVRCR